MRRGENWHTNNAGGRAETRLKEGAKEHPYSQLYICLSQTNKPASCVSVACILTPKIDFPSNVRFSVNTFAKEVMFSLVFLC